MEKIKNIGAQKFVFGSFFMVANNLQALIDKELLQYDMTAKQWFLTIVISSLFDSPPTLKEVAETIGNSHQNVKQVALKLQSNGFLEIKNDEKDKRAIRLMLTEKSRIFWENYNDKSIAFMNQIFNGISEDEMSILEKSFYTVWSNINKMKNIKSEVE